MQLHMYENHRAFKLKLFSTEYDVRFDVSEGLKFDLTYQTPDQGLTRVCPPDMTSLLMGSQKRLSMLETTALAGKEEPETNLPWAKLSDSSVGKKGLVMQRTIHVE
jgi:hypothetical protein